MELPFESTINTAIEKIADGVIAKVNPESVKFSLKKNQPAENRLDSQSVMTFESRWGAFVAPGQLPGVKKGMQNKPPAVSNVGSAAGFSCRVL